jgi:hypothetical protein
VNHPSFGLEWTSWNVYECAGEVGRRIGIVEAESGEAAIVRAAERGRRVDFQDDGCEPPQVCGHASRLRTRRERVPRPRGRRAAIGGDHDRDRRHHPSPLPAVDQRPDRAAALAPGSSEAQGRNRGENESGERFRGACKVGRFGTLLSAASRKCFAIRQ